MAKKIWRVPLGQYLAQIRKVNNISSEELAIKVGITVEDIEAIEQGQKEITLEEAQKLAGVIGYSPYVVNGFFSEPVPPLTPEEKELLTCEPPPGAFLKRQE